VKPLILAVVLTPLLAVPAFAGCTEDFQAQTDAIPPLQSAYMLKLGAPQAEKCAASKTLLDAYAKLDALYKTCKSELKLTDSLIQQQDDVVADQQKSYAGECGG
jgi:hypothetical protein